MPEKSTEMTTETPGGEGVGNDNLLGCPFCGDGVKMTYEPLTQISIHCCASMTVEIYDALKRRGLLYAEEYQRGEWEEYPAITLDVAKAELAKKWNIRPNAESCRPE